MYPPPVRRTALGAVLIAIALALAAGCGGSDPGPDPSPTPSPSPTATATATGKVAPPLPPAATAHTKAGAIAFVRHYIDLINYAQESGDTGPLQSAEARTCDSCHAVEQNIQNIYGSGSFQGGRTTVGRVIDALPYPDIRGYTVDIAVQIAPSIVTMNGKTTHSQGGHNVLSIIVGRARLGWKVYQWSRAV